MRALSISSMLLETHTHFHYVHKLVPQLNTVGLIVSVLVSFIKLKLNLPGLQSPPPLQRAASSSQPVEMGRMGWGRSVSGPSAQAVGLEPSCLGLSASSAPRLSVWRWASCWNSLLQFPWESGHEDLTGWCPQRTRQDLVHVGAPYCYSSHWVSKRIPHAGF